eukprot:TRINITY_DN695_c0_g1_i1.p1 TRINITY_DN695_c0_g1~~TRINITY_DN695_c0_g1_i1.p1  ORF type:complete len:329 (-),score=67.29 TRINITY_DN695_c0_g1_i1:404-1390(-)
MEILIQLRDFSCRAQQSARLSLNGTGSALLQREECGFEGDKGTHTRAFAAAKTPPNVPAANRYKKSAIILSVLTANYVNPLFNQISQLNLRFLYLGGIRGINSGQCKSAISMTKKGKTTKLTGFEMVKEAIISLQSRNGSSIPAIFNYIKTKWGKFDRKALTKSIKAAVKNGKLKQIKNSYKLSKKIFDEELKRIAKASPSKSPRKPPKKTKKPKKSTKKPSKKKTIKKKRVTKKPKTIKRSSTRKSPTKPASPKKEEPVKTTKRRTRRSARKSSKKTTKSVTKRTRPVKTRKTTKRKVLKKNGKKAPKQKKTKRVRRVRKAIKKTHK